MPRNVLIACGVLLLLLTLVAQPIWEGREQRHFGQQSDDGVYYVSAKAIASGEGYRIPSLPGAPYAIKYPPLYPAFLSIAWLIAPDFLHSLRVAAILQMLLLPTCMLLIFVVLRQQFGFSWRRTALAAGLVIVTLQMVLVTFTLVSELLCISLLLASILIAERASRSDGSRAVQLALAAGLVTGLAYLTRNAMLPMLAAAPVFFFLRKKARLGAYFVLTALPLMASWHIWVITRHLPPDATNSSYSAEYAAMISLTGIWSNFQMQLGALSAAVAEGIAPGVIDLMMGLPLYHIVLIAAIVGGIRICRRCDWPLYAIFTALYCCMLLIWWGGDRQRLILPVWPMLIAGIAEELSHLAALFEKSYRSSWPRWAIAGLGLALVLRNDHFTLSRLNTILSEERHMRQNDESAFAWIASHKTPETLVITWKDTTSYLYSGVTATRGQYLFLTPQTTQMKALASDFSTLPPGYNNRLLVLLRSDLDPTFGESALDDTIPADFRKAAEVLPESKLEFSSPGTAIYSFQIPAGRSVAQISPLK